MVSSTSIINTSSFDSDLLNKPLLLKKYHQNLVFDYTEYPTKATWDEKFNSEKYKEVIRDWFPKNKQKPILFYIHTPFCEQLCYFCLCSKEITQDYDKVKDYLYNYLFKEIDLLEAELIKNKIKLNVKELYFGGGSPTYYREEEFKNLLNRLMKFIDFDNINDFTVEIDPRRVNEEKLIFYHQNKVNRLSFGIQDFDPKVQEEINRIQPPELLEKLLTNNIKKLFPTINFDLLIGLPAQTTESISKTIDKVIELNPSQIQTMYMHYKPQTRKYMIKMLRNNPLPDFFDRKAIFEIASKKLLQAGYNRAGFESYALPNDPLDQSIKEKKAVYNSLGTQKGEATNFVAIGSSAHGCLGDDYYFQNYYEQNLYRKAIDENKFPIYRGLVLNEDDKLRRNVVRDIRTYFKLDFNELNKKWNIEFDKYFKNELNFLTEFEQDGLLNINKDNIEITDLGMHFSPQIACVFDAYNKINLNKY
jgi:oxygen-independent coproporphyrinogen-3 oxidase